MEELELKVVRTFFVFSFHLSSLERFLESMNSIHSQVSNTLFPYSLVVCLSLSLTG